MPAKESTAPLTRAPTASAGLTMLAGDHSKGKTNAAASAATASMTPAAGRELKKHAISITRAAIGSSQIILKKRMPNNKTAASIQSRTDGKMDGREMGKDMDSWERKSRPCTEHGRDELMTELLADD